MHSCPSLSSIRWGEVLVSLRYVPLNPSDFHSCLVGTHVASGGSIFQGNSIFTHGNYDTKGGAHGGEGGGIPFVAGSDGIATVQKASWWERGSGHAWPGI